MHIQKLLSYSCERYYLLSEIEQSVHFVFLDEPESKSSEQVSTQNPLIDVIYLLWKAEDGWEILKSNIQTILDRYPSCLSRCLIVVECLTRSEEEFENDVKDQLERIFKWADKAFPDSPLFVGVCDQVSGTPGLEKVEEFLKFTVASAPTAAGNIRLIGLTRQECLGHDPVREPDAASGLYQVLVNSSSGHYAHWEKQYKEYVQKLYGVESAEEEDEVVVAAASPRKAPKSLSASAVVFFLAIVALAVAVMFQFSAITDQYNSLVNKK